MELFKDIQNANYYVHLLNFNLLDILYTRSDFNNNKVHCCKFIYVSQDDTVLTLKHIP